MEELLRIQVDAVKNIKIDKVTVWDNGAGGQNGKTATAGFVSGMMKSIPPLGELFDMAGMKLPEYLGTEKSAEPSAQAPAADPQQAESPADQAVPV